MKSFLFDCAPHAISNGAMPWFAVQSLYLCRQQADGTNIFEERIVVFSASSTEEAFAKAQRESAHYARTNGFTCHPVQRSYEQDGEPLIDGYEVWSVMLAARASLEEFHGLRYARYEYHPE